MTTMFSNRHPSTQATSTHGKSVIHYNSDAVFVYKRIHFYIILNVIVFIAAYGHVHILMIQINCKNHVDYIVSTTTR